MSLHYPHHVGTIDPAERADTGRTALLTRRHPAIAEDEPKEILTFRPRGTHPDVALLSGHGRPRPELATFIARYKAQIRAHWRESAALAAGILVLLVTAWLIWAAVAEAILAAAHAG